jgi:putative MFS transporter
VSRGFLGITTALTISGVVWGLVNFGLLLWLPAALVAEGRSVGASSALIARSTLLAAPTILLCAWMFSAWSTKWSLITMTAVMVAGLAGLAGGGLSHPLLPLALVILGSCGLISMLLPYTAENYPLRIRGRATGWIAACSKLGGLIAQTLSVLGAVPTFATTILAITVPALASAILIARFGHETRGLDLHHIDGDAGARGRRPQPQG